MVFIKGTSKYFLFVAECAVLLMCAPSAELQVARSGRGWCKCFVLASFVRLTCVFLSVCKQITFRVIHISLPFRLCIYYPCWLYGMSPFVCCLCVERSARNQHKIELARVWGTGT